MVRALALALAVIAGAGCALSPSGALAQAGGCRLALLLALDVSSSVDDTEYVLQKEGLAAALADPDIRGAILDGEGRVALSVYEWSGRNQSTVILDWTLLDGEAALARAGATILAAPRSHNRFPTAMGFALGFGATHLARAPMCGRRVIDLSGDGITNDGFRPRQAYEYFPFEGVVVNGLAVLGSDARVVNYFRNEVAHGPGAFVEVADGYDDFRRAMTLKLFRELNDMVVGGRGGKPDGVRGGERGVVLLPGSGAVSPSGREAEGGILAALGKASDIGRESGVGEAAHEGEVHAAGTPHEAGAMIVSAVPQVIASPR